MCYALDAGLCGNEELLRVRSPDGEKEAVVFTRSCGAMTGFVTHLSIIRAGATLPNKAGNASIYDGKAEILVEWVSPEEVRVVRPPGVERVKENRETRGVELVYEGG